MLKKAFKVMLAIGLLVILIEGLRALLLIFPHLFFTHSYTFQQTTFYSDQPFSETRQEELDTAVLHVAGTEIYHTDTNHRIFLCNTKRTYAFFSMLAGKNQNSQGFNVEPTGNIFISESFIESIRSRYGTPYQYTLLEGNITHIISHEMLHTLITRQVGFWQSRRLPTWIKEGYAEYGASKLSRQRDQMFDLKKGIDRFYALNTSNISTQRLLYLKSQLLIQYLIEVEGHHFNTIIDDQRNEAEVFEALSAWYRRL